jgi:hypothetical protein
MLPEVHLPVPEILVIVSSGCPLKRGGCIKAERFKTEPSEDAGSDNTVRETANYLGALPGVSGSNSISNTYMYQDMIWIMWNCSPIVQNHISTPYNKIGTTIVSNSSNCIAIGKFNFLASSRLSTWPFLLVVQDVHTLYLYNTVRETANYLGALPGVSGSNSISNTYMYQDMICTETHHSSFIKNI